MTEPLKGIVLPGLPAGFDLVAFDDVGSTNTEAVRRAEAGAPGGLLVWARSQNAGRGRRGRTFFSPPGNTYSSVVLRPNCGPAEAAQISFVTAIAVVDAARSVLPDPTAVTCKWPNDVLILGQKVSGISLESRSRQDGLVDWVVLGVGINVQTHPENLDIPITSLHAEGATATVEDVLLAYIKALDHWLSVWREQGFAAIRAAWLDRADGLGTDIQVRLADRTYQGRFESLDEDGALILLEPDGNRRRVTAGDVFRPAG